MPATDDLVAEVHLGHHHIRCQLEDLLVAGDPAHAAEALRELGGTLRRHEAAEASVVEPLLRRLPGGADLVVDGRAADLAMNVATAHLVNDLLGGGPTNGSIDRLAGLVTAHLADEEHHVLPLLRSRVGAAELTALAPRFRAVEQAPGDAYPGA